MNALIRIAIMCVASGVLVPASAQQDFAPRIEPTLSAHPASTSITGNNNVSFNASNVSSNEIASVLRNLRPAGSSLDASDEFELIRALETGDETKRDLPRAFRAYDKLAKEGNIAAHVERGRLLLDIGSTTADALAHADFEASAAKKSIQALTWQAWMHEVGRAPKGDFKLAISIYEKAAQGGDGWASFRLGVVHQTGTLRVGKDENAALNWYQQSADRLYPEAFCELGWIRLYGEARHRDEARGLREWETGAKLNNACSLFQLGLAYHEGKKVSLDYTTAASLYERAAILGDVRAQNNLGNLLLDGLGLKKDASRAVELYRKAALKNEVNAPLNLGTAYEAGNGVDKDDEAAVRAYKQASDRGHAKALAFLGSMYRRGKGVEQDIRKARELFELSANGGSPVGAWYLGLLLSDGKDVPADMVAASSWFRKAAEFGSSDATNALAYYISSRQIVAIGNESPTVLWERAVRLGNQFAMYNLGRRYLDGEDVPVDVSKGLLLLERSAKLDHDGAKIRLAGYYYKERFKNSKYVEMAARYAISAARTIDEGAAVAYALSQENPHLFSSEENALVLKRLQDMVGDPSNANHAYAVVSLARGIQKERKLAVDGIPIISALQKLAQNGNQDAAMQLFLLYGKKAPLLFFDTEGKRLLESLIPFAGDFSAMMKAQLDFFQNPSVYSDEAALLGKMEAAALNGSDTTQILWTRNMVTRSPEKAGNLLRAKAKNGNTFAVQVLCELLNDYKLAPASHDELARCGTK